MATAGTTYRVAPTGSIPRQGAQPLTSSLGRMTNLYGRSNIGNQRRMGRGQMGAAKRGTMRGMKRGFSRRATR